MRVRSKRYTPAVRRLIAGETTSDVLAEFLELLDGLGLGVKAVYLDRGFYNRTCPGLLTRSSVFGSRFQSSFWCGSQ